LKLLTNLPVFGIAQGIFRQRVEMTAGIGAEIAKSVENPKNSLLNSLDSGNLRVEADPPLCCHTARYGSKFGNAAGGSFPYHMAGPVRPSYR
jgi:hypothetical protein